MRLIHPLLFSLLLSLSAHADTAPQLINKTCSAHMWFESITPGAAPTCTQPAYADISGSAPASAWGSITGTLSSQTDLATALGAKVPTTTTVNGHTLSSNITVSSTDVGLGNVTNNAQVTSVTASAPVASSGGTTPVISCITATGSSAGCLSSADWVTFNGKQSAGNYITAVTGDGIASGPGSATLTLATVNTNVGSFPKVTVNGKGLVTAATVLASVDIPNNAANTSGNAATVTTNASMTGPITGTGNITSITSQTGTGTKIVVDTGPTVSNPTATGTLTTATQTQTGAYTNTFAGIASTPAMFFSGSPFATGTGTTSRPAFLMEDAATPSTTWNVLGTYAGVNALSTFAGDLLNLSKAGTTEFNVTASGGAVLRGTMQAAQLTIGASGILSTGNNIPVIVGSTRTFSTAGIQQVQMATSTFSASSGVSLAVQINPTINQTSTAGYSALSINAIETANGSGNKRLIDANAGAAGTTNEFFVDNTGKISANGTTLTMANIAAVTPTSGACFGSGGVLGTCTAGTGTVTSVAMPAEWGSAITTSGSFTRPPVNSTAKTTSYTLLSTDYTIYMNCGSACTVTMPSPSANSGHPYRIINNSANGVLVTFAPASAETFCSQAYAAIHMSTQGEAWELASDATNWACPSHKTDLADTTFTMTLTGTTTNPVRGTVVFENAKWSRLGNKMMVRWDYSQLGAGTAGSGTYLMALPIFTMDTTAQPVHTGVHDAAVLGAGSIYQAGNISDSFAHVRPFDSTHLALVSGGSFFSSTLMTIGSASQMNVSFQALVPISNWEP